MSSLAAAYIKNTNNLSPTTKNANFECITHWKRLVHFNALFGRCDYFSCGLGRHFIAGERIVGFILFPRVLALCEMWTAEPKIWTLVVKSISYNDIHHTSTSKITSIYKKRVKLVAVVEGNPKAPFSIATTPRCWGECHSFPRIAPIYPWYVPYNAEC